MKFTPGKIDELIKSATKLPAEQTDESLYTSRMRKAMETVSKIIENAPGYDVASVAPCRDYCRQLKSRARKQKPVHVVAERPSHAENFQCNYEERRGMFFEDLAAGRKRPTVEQWTVLQTLDERCVPLGDAPLRSHYFLQRGNCVPKSIAHTQLVPRKVIRGCLHGRTPCGSCNQSTTKKPRPFKLIQQWGSMLYVAGHHVM